MKSHTLLAVTIVAGTFISATLARSAPSSTRVSIIDFAFDPAAQTITAGQSITWQNEGQEPHNVVDSSGAWESPALSSGQSYTFVFATPGTYTYYCTIHSGMLGTITVAEAQPQPPAKVYIAEIQR